MIDVTIIIITYKSENIIYNFLNKIPSNLKTIIIENSQNNNLKKNIEEKYKNITVHLKENNGISSSLNFAVKLVTTKYFLQISPDIDFNYSSLNLFIDFANKKNDNFAALGPRFLEVDESSHKQIKENLEFGEIDSIHGSCMFINKKNFIKMKGFDENFFLYYEETDYCKRSRKKNLNSYQLNKISIKQNGRSVSLKSEDEKEKLEKLLTWHFIWSKYYYYNKNYGNLFSVIYFQPILIRSLIKITYFYFRKNKKKFEKYKYRINGLFSSIIKKKSYLRIDKIP